MLYSKEELQNALFIKIGTEARYAYNQLPENLLRLWNEKYAEKYSGFYQEAFGTQKVMGSEVYDYYAKYNAEFCKITSFSFGLIEELTKGKLSASVETVEGTEVEVLDAISMVLGKCIGVDANKRSFRKVLAGFNIIGYQIPLIVKKMLVNRKPLPTLIQLRNKKPWEVEMIDVVKDYQGNQFGDVDIRVLAEQFGVQYTMSNAKPSEELTTTMEIAIAMCQ